MGGPESGGDVSGDPESGTAVVVGATVVAVGIAVVVVGIAVVPAADVVVGTAVVVVDSAEVEVGAAVSEPPPHPETTNRDTKSAPTRLTS